jgi:hypothetical protein
VLVGLAAWARIPRATPPLDEAHARALLAEEWPGVPVSRVWTSADGAAAVGQAGSEGLVVWRAGDGYRLRRAPLARLAQAERRGAAMRIPLNDPSTPRLSVAFSGEGAWPPAQWLGADGRGSASYAD